MDRIKQLEEIAEKWLQIRYKENIQKIEEQYHLHKQEVDQNCTDIMIDGFYCCQQLNKKVKYIIISVLESSLLTRSYDLQIAFYDEQLYLDEIPIFKYWKPMLIFSGIDEDMLFLKKKARIVRLKEQELDQIRKKYVMNHYFDTMLYLRQTVPPIIETKVEKYNCIENEIAVLFGRYMERPILLYKADGGNGNEIFFD